MQDRDPPSLEPSDAGSGGTRTGGPIAFINAAGLEFSSSPATRHNLHPLHCPRQCQCRQFAILIPAQSPCQNQSQSIVRRSHPSGLQVPRGLIAWLLLVLPLLGRVTAPPTTHRDSSDMNLPNIRSMALLDIQGHTKKASNGVPVRQRLGFRVASQTRNCSSAGWCLR